MNKTILIGLGVLAVAGIGYYMWKKNKTSGADGDYSNASGTKKCDCGFLRKPPKICSKSVKCNDCCAGSGTTGQTGSTI